VEAQAPEGAVMTYRKLGLFRARSRAENATACSHRVVGCYRLWVKRFSALDRLRESIRTAGQMCQPCYTEMTKTHYRLPGIYKRRGLHDRAELEARVINSKLCSLAFTPGGSVWCGSPSTIPITFSN
jgi:hypothetical protein